MSTGFINPSLEISAADLCDVCGEKATMRVIDLVEACPDVTETGDFYRRTVIDKVLCLCDKHKRPAETRKSVEARTIAAIIERLLLLEARLK